MPNRYNISRVRLLKSELDWRVADKYLVLLGAGFTYLPSHMTLADIEPIYWQAQKIVNPAVTPTGWAGSPPVTSSLNDSFFHRPRVSTQRTSNPVPVSFR